MIATAIQENAYVCVYDENNRVLFNRPGELVGFTSSTVSIKNNRIIEVYDETGWIKFTRPL